MSHICPCPDNAVDAASRRLNTGRCLSGSLLRYKRLWPKRVSPHIHAAIAANEAKSRFSRQYVVAEIRCCGTSAVPEQRSCAFSEGLNSGWKPFASTISKSQQWSVARRWYHHTSLLWRGHWRLGGWTVRSIAGGAGRYWQMPVLLLMKEPAVYELCGGHARTRQQVSLSQIEEEHSACVK